MVLPRERGLEREAVSWFTRMYPRTRAPGWPTARPIDIIQVRGWQRGTEAQLRGCRVVGQVC